MTVYNTKRGTVINLDNVEKVTNIEVERGFEIIFSFVSGKYHSMFFADKEECRQEYIEILRIMNKED